MARFINACGALFCTFVIGDIIYHLYRILVKRTPKNRDVVLFFPDKELTCPHHWKPYNCSKEHCGDTQCRFSHKRTAVSEIMLFLRSARRSVDVCMYILSHAFLVDVIVEVHKSGVRVRVITDEEGFDNQEIQTAKLRENGIPVFTERNETLLMHHKFVIVDQSAVLTGSLNWTRHAVTGNMENVIITSVPHLVKPFCLEFDRLWKLYESIAAKKEILISP